jgi:hypothetical protein
MRDAFLYSAVINYVVLIVWVLLLTFFGGWFCGLCSRWFGITVEQVRSWNFAGIMIYKIGIFLLNLVPFVALLIVGSR